MARTKPYASKHSSKNRHRMNPGSRHPNNNSSPSSSSSTSSHHLTISSPPPPPTSTPDPNRGRRGRQARPSQLSSSMQRAVRRFSRSVGAPNVVEPAGFRDFRGWLARLAGRESNQVWDTLIAAIAKDVNCNIDAINALKEDVVREIVKCVVVPRSDESAKLVSTNAGRQASRPRSGTTLMLVMERQLERVMYRLPQLVAEMPPPSPGSDDNGDRYLEGYHANRSPMSSLRHSSSGSRSGDMLPPVSDILRARPTPSSRQSLPSFRELDDSLKRNGSGSGSGSR